MIHDLTPAPVSTATITSPSSEQAELFSAEASPSRIRERSPSGTRRSRSADQKRTAALNRTGLKAPSPVGKNFVLDTNVLLHDPECIRHFEENHICIPFDVLRELDKFKQEPSERGANARQVHRTLTQMFTDHAEAATQGPGVAFQA